MSTCLNAVPFVIKTCACANFGVSMSTIWCESKPDSSMVFQRGRDSSCEVRTVGGVRFESATKISRASDVNDAIVDANLIHALDARNVARKRFEPVIGFHGVQHQNPFAPQRRPRSIARKLFESPITEIFRLPHFFSQLLMTTLQIHKWVSSLAKHTSSSLPNHESYHHP